VRRIADKRGLRYAVNQLIVNATGSHDLSQVKPERDSFHLIGVETCDVCRVHGE
jgi:hypothetical protein